MKKLSGLLPLAASLALAGNFTLYESTGKAGENNTNDIVAAPWDDALDAQFKRKNVGTYELELERSGDIAYNEGFLDARAALNWTLRWNSGRTSFHDINSAGARVFADSLINALRETATRWISVGDYGIIGGSIGNTPEEDRGVVSSAPSYADLIRSWSGRSGSSFIPGIRPFQMNPYVYAEWRLGHETDDLPFVWGGTRIRSEIGNFHTPGRLRIEPYATLPILTLFQVSSSAEIGSPIFGPEDERASWSVRLEHVFPVGIAYVGMEQTRTLRLVSMGITFFRW